MDSNLFNNPAFANLSPEKLQFLLSFAQKEKPLNMKDAMPLCDLLSKDLPPESQTQMKKIMSLMSMNRSHPAP